MRYHKKIKPVQSRSACDISDDCKCPRCNAPKIYLYKNNGSKGQLWCKVCNTHFSPEDNRYIKPFAFRCPYCSNTPVPKKERKHFIVYKCVNPKCSYYLHTFHNVDKDDLREEHGKSKYKLHYIYRKFTVDFFRMDLNPLPPNASSLKFTKNNAYIMSLCLTFLINLGLSLRKTAAICVKSFLDNYDYQTDGVFTADETYIKVRGIKGYIWFIMDPTKRFKENFKFEITQVIGLTTDDESPSNIARTNK